MVFLYTSYYFLRYAGASGVVAIKKDLLAQFDRQFPISYSYVFLQQLKKEWQKLAK